MNLLHSTQRNILAALLPFLTSTTRTVVYSFSTHYFVQNYSTKSVVSTAKFSRTFHTPDPTPSTRTKSVKMSSKLSPRVLDTLDPCVVLMKEMIGQYSHLWEGDDKGGIFSLAQGVVHWEPPGSCTTRLQQEFAKPSQGLLHTYGPAAGIPELVSALEQKIATENGLNNHSVMVTVGANQAYVNTVLTCLSDQSKSIVFAPFYFNHVMAIQMCCGKESVVVGPCTNDGIPNLEWLQTTLQTSDIDMVTIVNPGNPTGVTLTKDFLQQAVDLCRQYNAWLVLDCTYEYFIDTPTLACFPNDPHVIHIFSFSKSYSMAGYRCGYICISKDDSTNMVQNMIKVQDTIPIGPPRMSQIIALGALQAGPEWVKSQYATLETSRNAILDALQSTLSTTIGGTGAMYVMGKLPENLDIDDVEVCRQLVKDYGIAIIPGTYCGFSGWIRVCYANLPPDQTLIAAERLKNGLTNICNKK